MVYADLSSKKLRLLIYNKFNGRCAYCGVKIEIDKLSIDHIVPIKRKMGDCKRGDNIIENLNPSCKTCNCSKSHLSLDEWRDELMNKINKLWNDSPNYRICIKYKLITETYIPVVFYFEKLSTNE